MSFSVVGYVPSSGIAGSYGSFSTSLVAQLVKNPPVMQETQFDYWVKKIPLRKDRLPTPVSWASLVAQMVKNLPARQETGFNPWVGKIPLEEAWQPTRVFLPAVSPWQRSLGDYSP